MSKIKENPLLPTSPEDPYLSDLSYQLTILLREIAFQLNRLTEGRIEALHTAHTAAPTSGDYQQGDKVFNTTPTEEGAGGSKYVIIGWVCVASGTPGTWKEMRVLTGG